GALPVVVAHGEPGRGRERGRDPEAGRAGSEHERQGDEGGGSGGLHAPRSRGCRASGTVAVRRSGGPHGGSLGADAEPRRRKLNTSGGRGRAREEPPGRPP